MKVSAIISIKLNIDDTEFIIHEGDIIHNLSFLKNGEVTTITGSIRVIDVVSKSSTNIVMSCPPSSIASKLLTANTLFIDVSSKYKATIERINIKDIISIGSIETPKEPDIEIDLNNPDVGNIDEIINMANDKDLIKFSEGSVTQEIHVTKNVTIEGATSGISQNYKQEV